MVATPLSLLERLQREPEDALSWDRLTGLYTPLVRKWLISRGTSDSDLDDLTQEILLVLVREIPRFDHNGQTGAFRSWVRTITVNRLRNFWRSRRREATNHEDDWISALEDPESDLRQRWDREHDEFIAQRLLELIQPEFSPTTWQGFRRHVIDGIPASSVAAELGCTPNAVLISKSRVLRRLRQESAGILD